MIGHRDPRDQALEDHLRQCADEYVADVNGPGLWEVHVEGQNTPDEYVVDFDVTTGPVVMVRRSDGQRFEVDVVVRVGRSDP